MADEHRRGVIGWFVDHRVAPNLIMLVLILGGLFMTTRITQEVFPDFQREVIDISVAYPGATPSQIESGVVLPVEEAVRGLEGVKKVTATAREGAGSGERWSSSRAMTCSAPTRISPARWIPSTPSRTMPRIRTSP
ncbi:MAG: efflux RND transporter permease subunit [Arhodomonas sp.]|nr:efflux RND transporter permease subunit [Arhodomonas sp.]